jgi:hypothetical protein
MGKNEERIPFRVWPVVDAEPDAEIGHGPVVVGSKVDQQPAEAGPPGNVVALDYGPARLQASAGVAEDPAVRGSFEVAAVLAPLATCVAADSLNLTPLADESVDV